MASLSSVGTIQAEIATRLNEVSATEADTYLNWINLTTQDIATQYQLGRWLETSANRTVSSGTRIYAVPSDLVAMYSIYDETNGWKLSYVTKQEYDASHISSNTGNPTRYTINMENIEFDPTPGSSITYRYEYRKTLLDVSAASASLPIPTRYLEMYVFKGLQYGLERRGDYNQSAKYDALYQNMLQRMINELKDVGAKRIKSGREFRPQSSSDPIKNTFWNS